MKRQNPQSGYALLVVVFLAAMVLITLGVAVPRALTQGQREKEEELIFRGQQYSRAVGLFFRKFARFPTSTEELLRTNELSFLRRSWPDPMTRHGQWRLIRVGPAGELIGSVTGGGGFALPGSPGTGGGEPAPGVPPADEEDDEDLIGPPPPEPFPPATPIPPPPSSPAPSPPDDQSSLPIIGVASRSTARAKRIYNGYQQYNQWEFIFNPVQDALRNRPPGTVLPPGANPPPSAEPR